jgi:hypothetical protein
MKDVLKREFAKQAEAVAKTKKLSQAQVTGKQVAEQIIAQVTIAAQEKVKALLAQVKAGTAALKQSTLDAKMMALLTGSTKPSSVDNRMAALAAQAVTRDHR